MGAGRLHAWLREGNGRSGCPGNRAIGAWQQRATRGCPPLCLLKHLLRCSGGVGQAFCSEPFGFQAEAR